MQVALIATIMSVLELIEEWGGFKIGLTQVGVEEVLQVLTIVLVWLSSGGVFNTLFNRHAS